LRDEKGLDGKSGHCVSTMWLGYDSEMQDGIIISIMKIYLTIKGLGEQLGFLARAMWAWDIQKQVATLTGIRQWDVALKRKMDIEDEGILPVILRESKSIYNVKSVKPVPYDEIPDDLQYEISSRINFSSPAFTISYSVGGDPLSSYAEKSVHVNFVDETKISRKALKELFVLLIRYTSAHEAAWDDGTHDAKFNGKINFTVQEGDYKKIVRYKWTGLCTFLPDALLAGFDKTNYVYEIVDGAGIIISMEGVNDVDKVMCFNRDVAALYGCKID
jgi:hypothetical protein